MAGSHPLVKSNMQNAAPGRLPALSLAVSLLLAACGGGGNGTAEPATPPSARFGPSGNYAGDCTLDGQKMFIRAYMDETYLWYNDIPDVPSSQYTDIPDYFYALLVRTPDANGLPRDRFSAAIPAGVAGELLGNARTLASVPMPQVSVMDSPGTHRHVGYIEFLDFSFGMQDQMIDAFRQVHDAGVQDLVLDLRANSGGYLYIAQSTASMVTGGASIGRVFEQLNYSDKRGAETQASKLNFISTVEIPETRYGAGTDLPQLNLPRLYVLTSGATCSASESVINSLRGVDVQVILVGDTTCGKPYGFHERDNCGYAFFPIEFKGTNAKGFGDYTTGFTPTCNVADNPGALPGSASDPLLSAAFYHVDNGSCPAGTATAQGAAVPLVAHRARPARPAWAGRLLH